MSTSSFGEAREYYGSRNATIPPWLVITIAKIDWLRLTAIIFCLLFVLTLHIYLVYVLRFLEEKRIREFKEKQAKETGQTPVGVMRNRPDNTPEPRGKALSQYDIYLVGV
ncbi:unnamed protein product [Orchesella dallaii]|uniref:Uncharacterized protein n=1 Tax=Orchesella dallaii TaxID=48710 RepID=A0ABP1RXK6_9HEXA